MTHSVPLPRLVAYDEAIAALDKAVATQGPDFVYADGSGCYYRPIRSTEAHGRQDPRLRTGCLIGVTLDILNVTYDRGYTGGFRSLVFDLRQVSEDTPVPIHFTQRVEALFAETQLAQDRGIPWGEARDIGVREATGYPDKPHTRRR